MSDVSDNFFNGNRYEVKYLKEFNFEEMTDVDKLYDKKPQRVGAIINEEVLSNKSQKRDRIETGYCIRTGEIIPFNPERPFSYNAYKMWAKFENPHYPEKYCIKRVNYLMGILVCLSQYYKILV